MSWTLPPDKVVRRFWAKVNKATGCWEWQGARSDGRYGAFWPSRERGMKAHRFSWQLANGPIPDGMHVLHRCDNPPCVRPDHLFLGTARDNAIDRQRKGRGGQYRAAETRRTNLMKETA